MPMLASYFGALVAFVAFDMVWLAVMVERIYRPAVGPLMSATVNLPAAIIFYLLAPLGLTYFAVLPAVKAQSLSVALVSGALYGFFTYMTYDLTNQATLKSWSTTLSIADIAWGAVLGAIAASSGYFLASRFLAH